MGDLVHIVREDDFDLWNEDVASLFPICVVIGWDKVLKAPDIWIAEVSYNSTENCSV